MVSDMKQCTAHGKLLAGTQRIPNAVLTAKSIVFIRDKTEIFITDIHTGMMRLQRKS